MKHSEILYLIGFAIIALSVIFFVFSILLFPTPDEDSSVNLLGTTTDLDTSLSRAEAYDEFKAKERAEKLTYLWIGVLVGTVTFLSGVILKKIKEGPDAFLDDEFDDEENDEAYL